MVYFISFVWRKPNPQGMISMAKKKKETGWTLTIIIAVVLIILVLIVLAANKKIGCETVTKYKTEFYSETVQAKNCDYDRACRCIHKSLLGFGACDSCQCSKTRQVPYTVEECLFD